MMSLTVMCAIRNNLLNIHLDIIDVMKSIHYISLVRKIVNMGIFKPKNRSCTAITNTVKMLYTGLESTSKPCKMKHFELFYRQNHKILIYIIYICAHIYTLHLTFTFHHVTAVSSCLSSRNKNKLGGKFA